MKGTNNPPIYESTARRVVDYCPLLSNIPLCGERGFIPTKVGILRRGWVKNSDDEKKKKAIKNWLPLLVRKRRCVMAGPSRPKSACSFIHARTYSGCFAADCLLEIFPL